jgi:hypothetical protein
MKFKLILLATAAMLVATNAQAGFLTPESKRCTSNHFYGIYKPNSTRQGNCDVAADRARQPQAERPYQPITAPGMLIDVPHDTVTPLVEKEIEAGSKQDPASLPAITRDPRLLQYLPKDYFNQVRTIAAFNRLARVDLSYVNPPLAGLRVRGSPPHAFTPALAGYRVLAERLRCLVSHKTKSFSGTVVCEIGDDDV